MIKVWGADDATLAYKMREKRIVTALAMDRNGVVTGKQASKQASKMCCCCCCCCCCCSVFFHLYYTIYQKRKRKKEKGK